MKTAALAALALLLPALATAAISRDELKKALDANPDLVISALSKADKMKFFELVIAGQQEFQMRKAKEEAEREEKEREEFFKNPLKPDLAGFRHAQGKADAPITIVEYSDYECPYCTRGLANLQVVKKKYGDKIRVIFKNYPLSFHPKAMPAALWMEAIAMQSPEKAWAYHDKLFANQDKLGDDYIRSVAKELGVDMAKAEKDAASKAAKDRVEADINEAKKFGFEGTPGYLINGVPLRGSYPPPAFFEIIDRQLKGK
jgi:protein-disulfide isomerase